MNAGYTITINDACKSSTYSHLPSDNNGLFVYANSTAEQDSTGILKDIDNLNAACIFDGLSVLISENLLIKICRNR